jgi:hypothetical protein
MIRNIPDAGARYHAAPAFPCAGQKNGPFRFPDRSDWADRFHRDG